MVSSPSPNRTGRRRSRTASTCHRTRAQETSRPDKANAHSDDPVFTAGYARVLAAGRPLLLAAQQAGQARAGLSLEQILDLFGAIAQIPGEASYRDPILDAALRALQSAPGT